MKRFFFKLYSDLGDLYVRAAVFILYDHYHNIPLLLRRTVALTLFRVACLVSPGESWHTHRKAVYEIVDQLQKKNSRLQRLLDGK